MKKTLIAVTVLGTFCVLGSIDYSEALIQEAMEKEARPMRASQPLLSHPIDYRAIVCQAGPGEPPRCRYYAERAK